MSFARSIGALTLALGCAVSSTHAQPDSNSGTCPVSYEELTRALKASVKASGGPSNGGLDNNMWAAVVTRDGSLCAVSRSGQQTGDQWPVSRGIAIAKANTANGLGLPGFALSTANLWAATQPGGSLYGLITVNPQDTALLHTGEAEAFGTQRDPALRRVVGGTIVFGGGLALYRGGQIVGALGVSGDTSCADHNVAWRVRQALELSRVPAGPAPGGNDAIIYDVDANGHSRSGFGHPTCGGSEAEVARSIGAGAVVTAAAPPPVP